MWTFSELSVQSGVSSLIRSNMTDFAITWEEFCIKSFKMANSVRVSFTVWPQRVAKRVEVSNSRSSKRRIDEALTAAAFRSCTAILASSSFVSNRLREGRLYCRYLFWRWVQWREYPESAARSLRRFAPGASDPGVSGRVCVSTASEAPPYPNRRGKHDSLLWRAVLLTYFRCWYRRQWS